MLGTVLDEPLLCHPPLKFNSTSSVSFALFAAVLSGRRSLVGVDRTTFRHIALSVLRKVSGFVTGELCFCR